MIGERRGKLLKRFRVDNFWGEEGCSIHAGFQLREPKCNSLLVLFHGNDDGLQAVIGVILVAWN
jgi:hypothetical protein